MKLTKEIVKEISKIKNEPEWMTDFRLKSFEYFSQAENPSWGPKIEVDFDTEEYKISNLEVL